jgi:hypothetical protein
MRGLDPRIPIMLANRANSIEIAGTSPAMTPKEVGVNLCLV